MQSLAAALGFKGRTRSVKHVGWKWCCLCGHCLTPAFKKRKGIAAGRKVQTKNTAHVNLMWDLWLSEPNDYGVFFFAVGLFVIWWTTPACYPCAREAVIPSQLLSTTLRSLAFGNSFEDPKFSFWTCLLLGRQTVTELMLRRAVHRLFSIFDVVQYN